MKSLNKNIGKYCENLAKIYLKNNNYFILDINFRNKLGEIDIICKKNNTLIIVEVKGRYSNNFGYPVEAITLRKQLSLIKLAKSYITFNHIYNVNVQFDVIEVFLNHENNNYKINHIKDAFRL